MAGGGEMPTYKRPLALALAVAGVTVTVAVALTLALCLPAALRQPAPCRDCPGAAARKDGATRAEEAQGAEWEPVLAEVSALRSELAGVGAALQDARGRWDEVGTRLDTLQRNVTALEHALGLLQRRDAEQGHRAAALQEEHRTLKEDFAQQRCSLQARIREVLQELGVLRSRSPGAAPSLALALAALALALAGTWLR